jgi:hypothetical protein
MRTFVRIVKTGSLTAAANDLGHGAAYRCGCLKFDSSDWTHCVSVRRGNRWRQFCMVLARPMRKAEMKSPSILSDTSTIYYRHCGVN